MSIERRWQILSPCNLNIAGAGTSVVNRRYCEVAEFDGHRMWVREGSAGFTNAIFWAAVKWVLQSNGSVMYDTTDEASSPDGAYPINWTLAVLGTAPPPNNAEPGDQWDTVYGDGYAKFTEEEDFTHGCMAKRKKLTSEIVFSGSDFDRFLAIERDPVRRCEEITIRRQWRCFGAWRTAWTGTFSTGAGSWDFDRCEFTVTPEVLDEYTCIINALNKEVNVLQVGPVDVEVAIGPTIEWGATAGYHYPDIDPICTGVVPYPADVGDPLFGWVCAPAENFIDGDLYVDTFTICVRERFQTECIDGIPVPPAGTGWILLIDDCAGTGTATYVRPPEVPITFTASSNDPACASGTSVLVFPEYTIEGGPCDGKVIHARFVCYTVEVTEYSSGRKLQSVVQYLIDKSGCEITGLVSDFFEWDAPGDAPGYVAGMNYITGQPNEMNQLVLLQKSDAMDPLASTPATIGKMTLLEVFDLFKTGPRVFWLIDELGRLRFEHWHYWNFPVGLDIVNYAAALKSEPQSYSHLTEEVPKYERPKWMEARGKDFVGVDIEYSGPCVGAEQAVNEYPVSRFTTDIEYIIDDADSISTDGFVLLACTFNGTVYSAIVGLGALSGTSATNAPLSWANLERDFWTWDRFLFNANMNKVDVEFDGIRPNIEQRNVLLKHCCDYLAFDSGKLVSTALGARIGVPNASIRKAEFEEASESLTLTLRYAY